MAQENQPQYHRYRRYLTNIAQLSQQKKARTYGAVIFSILTVAFFIVFAIKPTVVAITALNKEIKDQKEIVKKLDNKIVALSIASQEYNKALPRLGLLDEALPQETKIDRLTNQIEAIAKRANVAIINLRYNQTIIKGEEDLGVLKPISINLVAVGPYQGLKDFLHLMSNAQRVITVRTFGLKPAEQESESSSGNLSLTLIGDTFYLSEGVEK